MVNDNFMTDKKLELQAKEYGWTDISIFYKLAPEQIDKYADKLNWWYISHRQVLTLEQIIKYKNKISPYWLIHSYYIDKSVKDKIEIGVFYE